MFLQRISDGQTIAKKMIGGYGHPLLSPLMFLQSQVRHKRLLSGMAEFNFRGILLETMILISISGLLTGQ